MSKKLRLKEDEPPSEPKVQRRRRPAAEIVRELRRLRSTPLRIEDDNESWTGNQEKVPPPDLPVTSLEQLEQIRLTRHRITMLIVRPFFEQAVTGCFVRVNINSALEQPEHRIAEILGLLELDYGYKLDEIPTNVALSLRYDDLVVPHEINDVSNMAFTRNEFELWRDNLVHQAIQPPTSSLVTRKKIELYNALQAEAKGLALVRQSFRLTIRPPEKGGILERHGGVYPWQLKQPSKKSSLPFKGFIGEANPVLAGMPDVKGTKKS
ncbi:RNA polymerase-associated protein RTF1 homolog [Drosophila kikkawai]|uniref:RNA polymerase-associated protein RTF1 homolog n=1 Tax=Drosophila kikkawai TaxID=30033 RepID=A0A6P4J462_DROKI|nr:RNA polymerase-associated protein RTF1 homolog [Drosophila kikkawai]